MCVGASAFPSLRQLKNHEERKRKEKQPTIIRHTQHNKNREKEIAFVLRKYLLTNIFIDVAVWFSSYAQLNSIPFVTFRLKGMCFSFSLSPSLSRNSMKLNNDFYCLVAHPARSNQMKIYTISFFYSLLMRDDHFYFHFFEIHPSIATDMRAQCKQWYPHHLKTLDPLSVLHVHWSQAWQSSIWFIFIDCCAWFDYGLWIVWLSIPMEWMVAVATVTGRLIFHFISASFFITEYA